MSDAGAGRDVVIAGAGVVGAAIARELSHFKLRCTLIDGARDVGARTSKANTALLHTGVDAKPGTIESRLVRRGHELLREYAPRAGIPLERTGALLVAWDEPQLHEFASIVARARANGYAAIREIGIEELYRRERHLGAGARGALEVPDEGIVCPFTTPLAFATEAVLAGCELRLDEPITDIERSADGRLRVHTSAGALTTRFLVNAAGLHSDELDRMLGHDGFTVTPRRGERARRLPDRDPRRRGLRVRRGDPLDWALGLDGDRRARARRARGRRSAARAEAAARDGAHAEHRRGVAAAVRAGRANRRARRLRTHRVLLRARDPR